MPNGDDGWHPEVAVAIALVVVLLELLGLAVLVWWLRR